MFMLGFSESDDVSNPIDYEITTAIHRPRLTEFYMKYERDDAKHKMDVWFNVRQGLYLQKEKDSLSVHFTPNWECDRNIMFLESQLSYNSKRTRDLEMLTAYLFATFTPKLTKYNMTSWKAGVAQFWENGIP